MLCARLTRKQQTYSLQLSPSPQVLVHTTFMVTLPTLQFALTKCNAAKSLILYPVEVHVCCAEVINVQSAQEPGPVVQALAVAQAPSGGRC